MPPRAKTLRGQKPRPSPLTLLSHALSGFSPLVRGRGEALGMRH